LRKPQPKDEESWPSRRTGNLFVSPNAAAPIRHQPPLHLHPEKKSPEDFVSQADLTAEDFWEKYVRKMEPVVIRGAVTRLLEPSNKKISPLRYIYF